MSPAVSRLDIIEEDQGNFGRVVTLLLNGVDILGGDDDHYGGAGWPAEEVLVPQCPLLPGRFPRRVALYRCGCGNWEDGNVTAIIREQDGLIQWVDIRSMGGLFTAPLSVSAWADVSRLTEPEYVDQHSQPPLGFPDVAFDPVQYRSEIDRAVRAWEATDR